ncbi:MAG: DNA polymerase III subunit gamma/tau [Nitrosomonadaceae bacterium]|nr:DNA polymerase III subunit gamma/tau [Nitrosomonadaceae bacterium]
MAHQVLARKWRPRRFEDVVGQDHVVKALSNALETGRIHHAYLFTGTRGVGKTTLARILAKALNCVGPDGNGGMTATPCGVCKACTEIDSGRFVDLLEVDAATNTKVDEMRELLETAQYAPVSGRYKVYIIDEVHMLSKSAFNAMLKTLEEPPGHVEFILATTDPQKLPITVLSRCLQFNLRNLAPQLLAEHLGQILDTEKIPYEKPALQMIGRAGEGSARDSLSLLDQAIAYGAGAVKTAEVATMLGALDQSYLYSLLDRIAVRDAKGLVAEIDAIAARAISFDTTLKELASALARVALTQTVGPPIVEAQDAPLLTALAGKFSVDDVQLVYQIALLGRRDLHLAPDEQSGFTMTLLRAIAFLDAGATSTGAAVSMGATGTVAKAIVSPTAAGRAEPIAAVEPAPQTTQPTDISNWPGFVASRNLLGMSGMLAKQAEFVAFDGQVLQLRVSEAQKHLADKKYLEKLKADLVPVLGDSVRINVSVGGVTGASLAAVEDRERSDAQAAAEHSIRNDPFVKSLADEFGATVDRAAIKPVQH